MVIQLLFKLDIRYFTPYYQSDFNLSYIVHMFFLFFLLSILHIYRPCALKFYLAVLLYSICFSGIVVVLLYSICFSGIVVSFVNKSFFFLQLSCFVLVKQKNIQIQGIWNPNNWNNFSYCILLLNNFIFVKVISCCLDVNPPSQSLTPLTCRRYLTLDLFSD